MQSRSGVACTANQAAQEECNSILDSMKAAGHLDLLNVESLYRRIAKNHQHARNRTVRYWVDQWKQKDYEKSAEG